MRQVSLVVMMTTMMVMTVVIVVMTEAKKLLREVMTVLLEFLAPPCTQNSDKTVHVTTLGPKRVDDRLKKRVWAG